MNEVKLLLPLEFDNFIRQTCVGEGRSVPPEIDDNIRQQFLGGWLEATFRTIGLSKLADEFNTLNHFTEES